MPFAGDGRVINDPHTPYVLAGKGVDPQGTLVARRGELRLYRIHGPLQLRSYQTGVYPDGWTGKRATYSRFATGPRRPGTLTIIASREGWKGNSLAAVVSIAIGTLGPRRWRRSRIRARAAAASTPRRRSGASSRSGRSRSGAAS